jgi:hypothetical protein
MNARIILFLSALLPLSDDCSYLIALERSEQRAPVRLQDEGTCAMANDWVSGDDLMARGY